MSELRDLTQALRAFDKRLTGIEDCLVTLVRDSAQQAEWRHAQKNRAMMEDERTIQSEKAVLQVQTFCGDIAHKLGEVVERLDNLAATRLSEAQALNKRIRDLETEEVTQS